jgi:hypothetical protein
MTLRGTIMQTEPVQVSLNTSAVSLLIQGRNDPHNPRIIKVEESGDLFYSGIKPKIRLCGLWLQRAGFVPGNFVSITNPLPGILTLQALKHANLINEANFLTTMAKLDKAIKAVDSPTK